MSKINLALMKGIEAEENSMQTAIENQNQTTQETEQKKAKRLTPEQKEEVLKQYADGVEIVDIAKRFDVHRTTIDRIVKSKQPEPPKVEKKDTIQAPQKLQKQLKEEKTVISTQTEEKPQNEPNRKPDKATMGFISDKATIKRWRLYAKATGQEISVFCTKAIDAYISQNPLNEVQKKLYDLLEKSKS